MRRSRQLPLLRVACELTHIPDRKALGETEEKAVARMGLTYGVLRRLGFSEERVIECLDNINGIDLDEAYDWVRLGFLRSHFWH